MINGVPFSTKSSTETGALVSNFFRALELYDGVLDIAAREKRELLPEKEVPLAAAKVRGKALWCSLCQAYHEVYTIWQVAVPHVFQSVSSPQVECAR